MIKHIFFAILAIMVSFAPSAGAVSEVGTDTGKRAAATYISEDGIFHDEVTNENADFYKLTDEEVDALKLGSEKVYVFDNTAGAYREVYSLGADERTSIASLTKIATVATFLKNTIDSGRDLYVGDEKAREILGTEVTITAPMLAVDSAYAKIGLYEGQKQTVRDLIYETMLPSAADAAQALAIYATTEFDSDGKVVSEGSVEKFVKLMNEFVEEYANTENTHFSNVYGLDEVGNYSTAREVAQILMMSLDMFEEFREAFDAFEYTTSDGRKIEKTLNKVDLDISKISGAKTGYTGEAGRCLASTVKIDGRDFIIATIGAPVNSVDYVTDTLKLANYIEENFTEKEAISAGEVFGMIPVKWGRNFKEWEVKFTKLERAIYVRNDATVEVKMVESVPEITEENAYNNIATLAVFVDGKEADRFWVSPEVKIEFVNWRLSLGILIGIIVVVIIICVVIVRKRRAGRRMDGVVMPK